MRFILLACALYAVIGGATAYAEDMVDSNPQGIMCRDEKALSDFAANDGSVKKSVMADPASATAVRFMTVCKGGLSAKVHVVTRRRNTSIVTYNGETWYVPNINFFVPSPDCLKDGSKVTMTGTIESAFAHDDEDNPRAGYHYPRLTLDKPVCYIGNQAERAGHYVSLPSTSIAGFKTLMGMVGRHVTISGMVGSPDTGHQPPDNMMMFDPLVRPAG